MEDESSDIQNLVKPTDSLVAFRLCELLAHRGPASKL